MKMTLSIRFMLEQISRLESLGLSREACLRVAKLTSADCQNVSFRVSIDHLVDVFNYAEKTLKNPNIGLAAGFKFRVSNYAQTGNIYGYCRNMPQVIMTNAKYQQIAIDAGSISYDQELDGQTGQIRHFMAFQPYMEDVDRYRHVIDAIAGAYCTAYRWLSWSSGQDILHIALPYRTPADSSEHERLFRCPIAFNQPTLRLEFSEKTIYHQISTYDAEKFARAEAQLLALIDSAEFCDSLQIAVKMAMRALLETGKIGTHIVAERMDKTWSVLRRELLEAKLSYRDLLENVRQEMFHECLEQDKPFSIIAQDLGYNDQAAFTKAFKRWYGVSPRQWKAAYQIGQTAQPDYTILT